MDKKLDKFLKEIGLDSQYFVEFEQARIDAVEYLEYAKYFILYLELDKMLKLDTYKVLISKINEYHLDIKLIIVLKQISYSADLVFDYYKYFLGMYKDGNGYLESLNFDFNDDVLKIEFANNGLKMMFEPFKTKLESKMKLAGFDLNYDYLIIENNNLNNKIDDLIRKDAKKIDMKQINSQKSKKTETLMQNSHSNRTTYRKSLKDLSDKKISKIIDVYDDLNDICFEGYIFDTEIKAIKNDNYIQIIKLTDFSDSIILKRFKSNSLSLEDLEQIKAGQWIRAYGDVRFDNFAKEHVMSLKSLEVIEPKIVEIKDLAEKKRVELHLHTNMSTMDGISHISEYLSWAKENNYTALAITDHNNIQAYPDAFNNALSRDIKLIYGLETNMIDDSASKIVFNSVDANIMDTCFVFFDFETTGLKTLSDEIIEIGAVKVKNGIEIDRFQAFVKPNQLVPLFIKELTGISDFDLRDAKPINEVLPEFIKFYNDAILVAHNASFDVGFLNKALGDLNLPELSNCYIDTLQLSRALNPNNFAHNLGRVAKHYKVNYDTAVAHRADYDAIVLASVFDNMISDLKNNHHIVNIKEINNLIDISFYLRQRPYHCSLLVKNQVGLKDLFKLVTKANTEYFYKEPNLLKSTIANNRTNLLVGSGCINGEIYQKASSLKQEELIELMKFYDYIEVFPVENQTHLVDLQEYQDLEEIREFTKYLVETAQKANVMVVASGDVHYLSPSQKEYREVYINAQGVGGKIHPLFDRKKRIKNIPNQHFRTTEEMLECFAFLGENLAYEIVVENTNKIAAMIEEVKPIKDKLYTPSIEGVDEKLTEICYQNAHAKYGEILPKIVAERLEKELNSITKHGFSVVYYISSLLVEKSLADGFLVGSRGSVGSSLVATLSNITEVNPLVPHYYCPNCQYSEFFENGEYSSGYDLKDKDCPNCAHPLKGDGQDIPFETFLGFEGNKVPDIDLNFSSAYQDKAHLFTKEIFGEDHVFRAGTISTVKSKTAEGYAKGYHENKYFGYNVRNTELERLAKGSEGVKRTTGQHPGGIIVIPQDMDVHDFTPVNYPADDLSSEWKTTHFDFHAIHDNVLKLDILGHVDPTALRLLADLTGVDLKSIPTNDPNVLSLFSNTEALNLTNPQVFKNGALGIPEFGTAFVRGMLEETKPSSFAELVQISGLSHGTDVWLDNAQTLIKRGVCQLKDVIGCRDDIMVYLMHKGLDPKLAFTIMESVRKGKGLNDEWIKEMKNNQVPEWYIDSCQKIKYMFPKAHAVAYVLMALRIAWFKVYYPLEYYAVYFSTRCEVYDLEVMTKGIDAIHAKIREIREKIVAYEASNKEKSLIDVFEMSLELYYRGFRINPIDLDKSKASEFVVDYDNQAIIPSFIALDSLGESVAESIVKARDEKEFISIEDLEKRTQVGKKHIEYLNKIGSLSHLQEKNQLSLF